MLKAYKRILKDSLLQTFKQVFKQALEGFQKHFKGIQQVV